ncbi:MAG: GNAT family protein [Vallitaleaceae bacterium]|nr:GNAT family protein [Vallitaleaceae bacterium]
MLYTDRLLLLRLKITDAEAILEFYMQNKDYLEPYEPNKLPSFYTLDYHKKAIQAELIKEEQGRCIKFLIYQRNEPNYLIGMVTLNEIVKGCFQSCFIGYKISKYHSNQGLMTEAVKAVTDYAFKQLKLHRIEANIMPRNTVSLRVVEKQGFVNEGLSKGYLKINDTWEDHIHMVLLNPNH